MEEVPLGLVEYFMKCGLTYEEISLELRQRFPNNSRGFSPRSVRRYCKTNNVTHMTTDELESIVKEAVMEVGSLYGRKLMTGFLLSKGFNVSEQRVGSALRNVAPNQYEGRRSDSLDRSNPVPYHACHFGHKVHLDQNEKLVLFGVTSVIARDGYSGKIVAFGIMPVKNCIAIYDLVFRKAMIENGLWHQVRVDHGREFNLVLKIQDYLRTIRGPRNISAYVQSPSTENLIAERVWPEVNSRVNYPIKRLLLAMVENGAVDMENDVHKFCVSFISCQVAYVGLKRFVESWNHHTIPGKGIPELLSQQNNYISIVDAADIPTVDEAVQLYESEGGSLQRYSHFGIDPLSQRLDLIHRRDNMLRHLNPTFEDTFTNIVSGDGVYFTNLVVLCISVTAQLSLLVSD